MDKTLENIQPEVQANKLHNKQEPTVNNYTENTSLYEKEKISTKINPNINPDNKTDRKDNASEILEKENKNENSNSNQITNLDQNHSARKYSKEIEVIISNVHNQNFKKNNYHYGYNSQRHQGSNSYKKNEYDAENYTLIDSETNKTNFDNSKTQLLTANANQQNTFSGNIVNANINNQNDNYKNNNISNNNNNFHYNSYYKNMLKNKSKSQNRDVNLNQINSNNNYMQSSNNFQNNNLENNINSNLQQNNLMMSNNNNINNLNKNLNHNFLHNINNKENNENFQCNFILQMDDQYSYKNKKNKAYNKNKCKKISKQNDFVNSYEKTTDFSYSKIFMNLNLRFLKQTYKIRDLNIIDYEMERLNSEKNKKNKKNKNENNAFDIDIQKENNNSINKNSSSEEMPTLNFINPYYFNNSQNHAMTMYNYNVLNHNPNILHQNANMNFLKNKSNLINNNHNKSNNTNVEGLNYANNNLHNFKNLGHIHNPDMNYLSDENANYDNFNFTNNNNLSLNLPLDNPMNQLRIQNQMQMGQNNNNYYDNLQMQNYNNFVNDPKVLEENILSGKYLTGVIRINKCHTHGYITVAGLYNDILIRGNRNLNQSLHLDEVIVELFPVVCWKPLFNKKMRKISYNNPKEDSTQQNILNMLRNEAATSAANESLKNNKNVIDNEKAKEILKAQICDEEKGKEKIKTTKKLKKSILKKTKKQSSSKKSENVIKVDDTEEGKTDENLNVDLNQNFKEKFIEINHETNIGSTIINNFENKKNDFASEQINMNSDIDDLSDSEPSDDDSQELSDSDEEDNLGVKVNSNNEKNYLSDDDKDDDQDYQISPKKINDMNYTNPNYMFDSNYGFNAENSKFKETFTTLEDRLTYINQLCNLRPEGRIVKILRSPNLDKNQIVKIVNEKSLIFACPIDENIPKIFIKMKKFRRMEFLRKLEHDHVFKNKYFLVRIVGWALNFKCPKGIIVNELGNSGDIEVETEVLLRTYDVDYSADYPSHIQENIKKFENWTIPEATLKKRHDLRNELIYTVDPKHSKDLDDAISCKLIDAERGLLEIGVHIADPSYFIPKDSLIDKEALSRTTTVYLVHRNIPMLPRLLSDNVISLLPFKDRLAFSCTFRIFFDGALDVTFQPKFYLSVINSAAKWNYELAQKIIDNEAVEYEELSEQAGIKPKSKEVFEQLCDSVRILHKLTKLVRSQRIESGSLVIENDELAFDLSEENKPINFKLKKKLDSHYMIEELMLIANKLSAEFIYDNVKDYALIRKHPLLNDSKFQEIQRYLTINNMVVDFEDSQALNEMLFKLEKMDKNKYIVNYFLF